MHAYLEDLFPPQSISQQSSQGRMRFGYIGVSGARRNRCRHFARCLVSPEGSYFCTNAAPQLLGDQSCQTYNCLADQSCHRYNIVPKGQNRTGLEGAKLDVTTLSLVRVSSCNERQTNVFELWVLHSSRTKSLQWFVDIIFYNSHYEICSRSNFSLTVKVFFCVCVCAHDRLS